MFGISLMEFIFIAVAALLIVKPEDIPSLLKNIGKFIGKFQRISQEIMQAVEIESNKPNRKIIDLDGVEQDAYSTEEVKELEK